MPILVKLRAAKQFVAEWSTERVICSIRLDVGTTCPDYPVLISHLYFRCLPKLAGPTKKFAKVRRNVLYASASKVILHDPHVKNFLL